jgi:mRNA interferase MazF
MPLKSVKGNLNSISKENLSGTFPSLSPPLGGPPEATRSAGGDSLIRQLPGASYDWLICMISSQQSQEVSSFDEIVSKEDNDFNNSGLKFASVIRIGRLAVVHKKILEGTIGEISADRLTRIKNRLTDWLIGK